MKSSRKSPTHLPQIHPHRFPYSHIDASLSPIYAGLAPPRFQHGRTKSRRWRNRRLPIHSLLRFKYFCWWTELTHSCWDCSSEHRFVREYIVQKERICESSNLPCGIRRKFEVKLSGINQLHLQDSWEKIYFRTSEQFYRNSIYLFDIVWYLLVNPIREFKRIY